jgi:hypothetical protein
MITTIAEHGCVKLEMDSKYDTDGEIEIAIYNYNENVGSIYLDKADVERLINHLQNIS